MNKGVGIAGGIAVALAAAWVGGAAYSSSTTAQQLNALMARPSSETGIVLQNLDHHKGLFSSSGSLDLRPQGSSAETGPAFHLTYQISHLVLPTSVARVEWTVAPSGDLGNQLKDMFGTTPQVDGHGSLAFNGDFSTTLSTPALSGRQNGDSISLSPLSGTLTAGSKLVHLTLALDKMDARGDDYALTLEKLALKADTADRTIGTGTSSISVEKISTAKGSAEGLKLDMDNSLTGTTLTGHANYSMKSATFSGQTARDLLLELELSGLDADNWRRIQQVASDSDGLKRLTADEDVTFRTALRTLLNRGVRLAIKQVSGHMDDSSLNGSLTAELKPGANDGADIDLASQIRLNGNVLLKSKLLTPEQTTLAVMTGLAKMTPDGLSASFSYDDKTIMANEQKLDADPYLPDINEASQGLNQILSTPIVK